MEGSFMFPISLKKGPSTDKVGLDEIYTFEKRLPLVV